MDIAGGLRPSIEASIIPSNDDIMMIHVRCKLESLAEPHSSSPEMLCPGELFVPCTCQILDGISARQ
ncbi:hypothetical protein O3M35_004957 [Rhynocoris fuscipes]|uniref:Uncharacterized protein n=1 Tax=Rhynocoris fuscipes TaxID=488301 RepID=A0AAW1DME8_9HEMI